MIVATDHNGGIGINNSLPWSCKEDMIRFRQHTIGKPIIMGRNTFESIGCKPLPSRYNIVVTTQDGLFRSKHANDSLVFVNSPKAALQASQYWYDFHPDTTKTEDVMVIGGAEIYNTFLPAINTVYLTTIHKEFKCNTSINELLSRITSQFDMQTVKVYDDPVNDCKVTFAIGSRKHPADVRGMIKLFK